MDAQGIGGQVWFDLPTSKTPESWLQTIGPKNRFEPVNDDKWALPAEDGGVSQNAYVEYVDGHYHAERTLSLKGVLPQ